jgi:hypothetical protein
MANLKALAKIDISKDVPFDAAKRLALLDEDIRKVVDESIEALRAMPQEVRDLEETIDNITIKAAFRLFEFLQHGVMPKPTVSPTMANGFGSSFVNNYCKLAVMPVTRLTWDKCESSEKKSWRRAMTAALYWNTFPAMVRDYEDNGYGTDAFDADTVIIDGRINLLNDSVPSDKRDGQTGKQGQYSMAQTLDAAGPVLTPADPDASKKSPEIVAMEKITAFCDGLEDGMFDAGTIGIARTCRDALTATIDRTDEMDGTVETPVTDLPAPDVDESNIPTDDEIDEAINA